MNSLPFAVPTSLAISLRLLANTAQLLIILGVLTLSGWFVKSFARAFIWRLLIERDERFVWATLHSIVGLLIFFNFLYGYLRAVLARPRSCAVDVEKDAPLKIRHCNQCNIDTGDDCEHCPICNVCVHELHHHCVFIGQCVGSHNLYYFEKFVRSVVFGCFYVFAAILLCGYARELVSLSILSVAIGIMAGGYLCIHTAFAHFMEKV
jgi:hypothetical protein